MNNIYNELLKYLNIPSTLNILLVIKGLRSAMWIDNNKEFNKKNVDKFTKYLDTLCKKYRIKYKFDDNVSNLKDGDFYEGPLIYNTKKLKKKHINIIEYNDIKDIYHLPLFGEILGYTYPLDIYKINDNNRYKYCTIRISIQEIQKLKNTGILSYKNNHYLYGFFCPLNQLNKHFKLNNKIAQNIHTFLKTINTEFNVFLEISYE